MTNLDVFDKPTAKEVDLLVGPFRYRLRAHDDWGQRLLQGITSHLACDEPNGLPDRLIHLLQDSASGPTALSQRSLAERFKTMIPEMDDAGWCLLKDPSHTIWLTPQSRHTFWTAAAEPAIGPVRFHLPWGLLIEDIIARGGGLVHGGLASFQGSGLLFLAPPGGGKSTTLSTAPPNWQVLSDDAALVWPEQNNFWQTSPLPAWGNMIRPESHWLYPQLAVGQHCQLKGLLLLHKENTIQLEKLAPTQVVPSVHRALSEYPGAIMSGIDRRVPMFRCAAQMARDLKGWRLSLPRHGDIWPMLVAEAA